jgi:hypothetical protein
VRRIAEALGAPVPREIRVDLDPNASAALRRGIGSLGSRDLTLTIGLPLAACLDARQLAGVVAHELGHFAQRGGMGVSYVIRAVNLWFARVVYERGSFDEELRRKSAQGHWMIRAVAGLPRAFVWASRKVLAGLMRLGWGLSGAMSRQMEFDADRYAARLVGARTFAETLAELGVVQAASHQSWGEVQHLRRERQLPSDVLALVADHRRRMPPELVARLHAPEKEQTSEAVGVPGGDDGDGRSRRVGSHSVAARALRSRYRRHASFRRCLAGRSPPAHPSCQGRSGTRGGEEVKCHSFAREWPNEFACTSSARGAMRRARASSRRRCVPGGEVGTSKPSLRRGTASR